MCEKTGERERVLLQKIDAFPNKKCNSNEVHIVPYAECNTQVFSPTLCFIANAPAAASYSESHVTFSPSFLRVCICKPSNTFFQAFFVQQNPRFDLKSKFITLIQSLMMIIFYFFYF